MLSGVVVLLSSGAAMAQPAQGQQFGDWVARCTIPQGAQTQSCALLQNIQQKTPDGQRRSLLAITVGYQGPNKIPTAILRVPLGIYLPAGLTLEFPGAKPVRIVLEICAPNGCVGAVALNAEMLDAMRKGERGKVALQDNRRRTINIPISLKGFTAGFASLGNG
tara:strand:+ start:209 stop:700 length:492 start_codon:yes stop_codon:yes gene_type:complete